jgi:hypothetical protein
MTIEERETIQSISSEVRFGLTMTRWQSAVLRARAQLLRARSTMLRCKCPRLIKGGSDFGVLIGRLKEVELDYIVVGIKRVTLQPGHNDGLLQVGQSVTVVYRLVDGLEVVERVTINAGQ